MAAEGCALVRFLLLSWFLQRSTAEYLVDIYFKGTPIGRGKDETAIVTVTPGEKVELVCKFNTNNEVLKGLTTLRWTTDSGEVIKQGTSQYLLPIQVSLPPKVATKVYACSVTLAGVPVHKAWSKVALWAAPERRPWSKWSPCHPRCGRYREAKRSRSCEAHHPVGCTSELQTRPCPPLNCSDGQSGKRFWRGPTTFTSRCLDIIQTASDQCGEAGTPCKYFLVFLKRQCRSSTVNKDGLSWQQWQRVKTHHLVKRDSSLWEQWTQWSFCSNYQQSRTRRCKITGLCVKPNETNHEERSCGSPPTTVTQATTQPPPTTNPTTHRTTHPTTVLVRPHSSAHVQTTHHITTHHAITSKRHLPTTRPATKSHRATTPRSKGSTTQHNNGQQKKPVSSTKRTDSYNLRVTVAVSSGLVGSLLLVAVIACWRRLHLEQLEQQRQFLQPEATQPEYHGLQQRNLLRQAPPPTYQDAFQLDPMRIQEVDSAQGSATSSPRQVADGTTPALPTNTSATPAPVESSPDRNVTAPATSGNEISGNGSVSVNQKVRTEYILSRLKAGMTEDEMPLDDDDVLSQSDSIPLI